jgi:polar amino acid transport system substrate-binding protein
MTLRTLLIFTMATLSLSTASLGADPVRIAHAQSFPPFAELKDGKSEGLAVDILRAAAARAGVTIEFVAVPFEQLPRTLLDGRADAIFPLANTPERKASYDFSAPLLLTGAALYVRAPNEAPEDLEALSGKTVVTPATGPVAAFIEKNAPAAKLVRTANYEESLEQLVNGQADVAALNFHTGARIAARLYPGQVSASHRKFMEVPFGVAVPKGRRADLLQRLDNGLAAIRADGAWQRINAQWGVQ